MAAGRGFDFDLLEVDLALVVLADLEFDLDLFFTDLKVSLAYLFLDLGFDFLLVDLTFLVEADRDLDLHEAGTFLDLDFLDLS